MRGAGGTQGGLGRFFIGLAMMIGGGYLFLNSINVVTGFHWGHRFHFQGFNLPSGLILIPTIFGIGLIFYNSKNILGWILFLGSLLALSLGVLMSVKFSFARMTAFDLIMILVLVFGGLGFFVSSLKDLSG